MTIDTAEHTAIDSLIGAYRRFGPRGPLYEVLRIARPVNEENPMFRIRVVESGEELDYSLSEILGDVEG